MREGSVVIRNNRAWQGGWGEVINADVNEERSEGVRGWAGNNFRLNAGIPVCFSPF